MMVLSFTQPIAVPSWASVSCATDNPQSSMRPPVAKARTLRSNRQTLDSPTTAQLLERAQECIELRHTELSHFYAQMAALTERQHELNSMRPRFALEADSEVGTDRI